MRKGGINLNKIFLALIITIIILLAGLSTCINIIITSTKPPIANASADVTFGQAPLNISFNASGFDPDDGKIKFYHWDFGDGTTSDKKNPAHTYHWRGKFFASLTVTDDEGENGTDIIEINVIEYQSPIAIASANITCGKVPLKIRFIGSCFDANGIIEAYEWDFGDGFSDNGQNVTHIYGDPGRYFVNLKVIDNDGIMGIDTMEINVIENYLPTAYALSDVTDGRAPLTVNFKGSGEDIDGTILSYHWVFEDTIIPANRGSNDKNTAHTFWFPGTYLVTLTVRDEEDATDTDEILINVTDSIFSWALEKFVRSMINKTIRKIV